MNNKLLLTAKAILENQPTLAADAPLAALWSLGCVHVAPASAQQYLQQTVAHPKHTFPLQGVALYHWQQCAGNEPATLRELYLKIVDWHRHLYERYDPLEEGLPHAPYAAQRLQDPLFLAFLVWSNEHLIQIGHSLQEDVLEVIQWNELTIFSMNDKLWNAEQRRYRGFDLNAQDFVQLDFIRSVAPLVGEVPTQDQAELLLPQIQRAQIKAERLNVFDQWVLRRGLLRYDFIEPAKQIRQRLLALIKELGFYEGFDLKNNTPIGIAKGLSPLTAVLTLDLLKGK